MHFITNKGGMSNNNELVSIITPTYNCAGYVEKTILSIINQTYTNWELLITDDCSADGTVEVVDSYRQKDPRIKLFRLETNSGTGVARNNSIKEARGRYIAFCDSDDLWLPEKLEKQIKFISENGYPFTYTSYYIFTRDSDKMKNYTCVRKSGFVRLLMDNHIGCLTAIYDTSVLGKIYMPEIRKRQDWALWLDIIKKVKKGYGLDEYLSVYRIRTSSVSSRKADLVKYNLKVYTDILKYNKLKSYAIFLFLFMPAYSIKKVKTKFSKSRYYITDVLNY